MQRRRHWFLTTFHHVTERSSIIGHDENRFVRLSTTGFGFADVWEMMHTIKRHTLGGHVIILAVYFCSLPRSVEFSILPKGIYISGVLIVVSELLSGTFDQEP